MAPLTRTDLARVFLRSLWLQASWSFQGMQSLGFAYALEPALTRIYDDEQDRRAAVERHLEFFNTNPLLASAIVGCVVRLEKDGGAGVDEAVRGIKTALMGPYGAIGDSLYWGALKPLIVLIALHAAFRGALWAPWVLVGLFAAANVSGRLYGFLQGYREGLGVIATIAKLNLLIWSRRIKAVCALLLGALLALAGGPTFLPEWRVPPVVWGGGALLFVVAAAWIISKGVRPTWMAYAAALVALGVVAWT